MRVLRPITDREMYERFGQHQAPTGSYWARCYAVSFKRPRGRRLRWILATTADGPTHESITKAERQARDGYLPYGVSQLAVAVVAWTNGIAIHQPTVPDDLLAATSTSVNLKL